MGIRKTFLSKACLLAGFSFACLQPISVSGQELLRYFQPLPPGTDTLHVEVNLETDTLPMGDTIPNDVFFTAMPTGFLQEIDYVADSSAALVLGRHHFPLNDSIEAYWVEIRQYWFQHHSLFLYDKFRKKMVGRATLAEWYGGDGGQVLMGSWVFDFNGDGRKDIVRREIQHSILPDADEAQEYTEEKAFLLRWNNSQFEETEKTSLLQTKEGVKRFPIRSVW
jgi:hypothetical protein